VIMSQFNASQSPGNIKSCELEFRGTKGIMLINEGSGFEIIPESTRTRELPALSPLYRKENTLQSQSTRKAREPMVVRGRAETADHTRNFLDCVKSRKPTNCPVDVGHRSTSATLVAKIALRLGRHLTWDGKAEKFADEEANRLLAYDYRPPWQL